MDIVDVEVPELHRLTSAVLTAVGTPADIAAAVADGLVGANRVGHDSHGVIRLIEYVQMVDSGQVVPDARAAVVRNEGATAVVDGNWGWGQSAGQLAVATVTDLAGRHGTATVTIRHCNHLGRLGEYAELLATAGLVSLMWCDAEPTVAPFGGRARVLGTNPIAAGIPTSSDDPIVMDFATAAAAEGKLRVAKATGAAIAEGLAIDAAGRPTTDPGDFYAGGALLPFGGHKGYGLSAVIGLLGGALSGNHPSCTEQYRVGNGLVMIALRADCFVPPDEFDADIGDAAAALRSSPPIDPDRPVLLPGDVEAQTRAERAERIPVADQIWRSLNDLYAARTGQAFTP